MMSVKNRSMLTVMTRCRNTSYQALHGQLSTCAQEQRTVQLKYHTSRFHTLHITSSLTSQLPINILHTIATFRTSQKLNFNFKCIATTREFGSVLLSRVHLVLLTLGPHDFFNDFP